MKYPKKKPTPTLGEGLKNKSKNRRLTVNSETQSISLSPDNLHSFVETGLKSMRLIDDSQTVFNVHYMNDPIKDTPMYLVTIKKEVQAN